MHLGNPLSDRQAQPGTSITRARGVATIEPLEHVWELFGSDAAARVLDGHRRFGFRGDPHPHRASWGRELYCVVEQDDYQLAHELGIADDSRLLELVDDERNARHRREGAHRERRVEDDVIE